MNDISKEELAKNYTNTFKKKPTGKEYVTLEQDNAGDDAEFAIYGNRLVNWLANRYRLNTGEREIDKGTILEIGCGMGRLMKPLSIHFKWVTGIDISAEILKEAEEYLRDIPNKSLFENDGKTLNLFADNSFDFVLTSGVLQHIPYRSVIEGYLLDAVRVLKPNGLFQFTFQVWFINITGSGRIGAKFTASWLNKVFNDLPVKIIEITSDPQDPLPHFSVLLEKVKQTGKVDFKSQKVLNIPWRTSCWADMASMAKHRGLQQKGQRKITFYDEE